MLPGPVSQWLDAPRGRSLRQGEAALVTESLEDCFGWEMLQIGAWGEGRAMLAGARTRSQALIDTVASPGVDVVSRLGALPIASDSIDCVLLPHTLEFEADPYGLLREVDRVLAGDGKLLVLGFAPWSPWGLRAGVIWANCYNKFDPTSPFGGYKESGFGREGGLHGLSAYLKLS